MLARCSLVFAALALVPLGCIAPRDDGESDAGADGASEGEGEGEGEASEGEGEAGEGEGEGEPTCTGGDVSGCTASGDGDFACTLSHGGLEREYLLHVPASYASGASLVFGFHGLRTTANLQEYVSEMKAASDANGYVLVYPEGTGPSTAQSWNAGTCCGAAVENDVDDVGFTLAMIERIEAALCIDRKRVYATGLSNGGHMAYRLACEQADVFAAVASVAGVVTTSCTPSRPVPVLHFHGTADAIVSYETGIDGVHGAERVVSDWAERNGCSSVPTTTVQQGEVTCVAHGGCTAPAELCTVDGGGHQWPGGQDLPLLGHNTSDISATDAISAFFAAHALP